MGFLNRLTGRSREAEPDAASDQSSASAVPAASSSELLSDSASRIGGALAGAVPEFSSAASPATDSPVRLYNPYQGLNAAVSGGRGLDHPAYKLPKQPEFLFSEEAAVHRRTWSENLTYYTGSGYLSGAILGGSKGIYDAFRTAPQEAALNTTRLKLNRLLNYSGKAGRGAGHTLGALGLFFSSFESAIGYTSDGALPDSANSILAGALTGAVFRSPRGLRTAGVAGGVGAVAASALVLARANLSKSL